MAFCGKCEAQVPDGTNFCTSCGSPIHSEKSVQPIPTGTTLGVVEKFKKFNQTEDTTASFQPQDIIQNKAMAILAYLGWLVLIPIFAAPQSRFARFHANQGLVLSIAGTAYAIVQFILLFILRKIFPYRLTFYGYTRSGVFTLFSVLLGLIWIIFAIYIIIGIINVVNGKAKVLPIIGKIRILK